MDNDENWEMHEECGVFGVFGPPDFQARDAVLCGLYALQHRGQEGAGMITIDKRGLFKVHRGMGLVPAVFPPDSIKEFKGPQGLGHTRYSTVGSSSTLNAQPFVLETQHGMISVVHNGQLTKGPSLRRKLMERGIGLYTESDSEVLAQYLAQSGSPEDRVRALMSEMQGAYSVVYMTAGEMVAFRDPLGMRPLCIGTSQDGLVHYVSSESCGITGTGAKFEREVLPGEMIIINENGLTSKMVGDPYPRAGCIFEFVYFARPDSMLWGHRVDVIRHRIGARLAKEHPCPSGDIVIGVPDSSTPMALAYSQASGIPFGQGLTRNRYIGRTFIKPTSANRLEAVKLKFQTIPEHVKGKSVVMIDDSLVRGTTIRSLATMLRKAGAIAVHIRIGSPPLSHPCFMGVNMRTKEELIANQMTQEELCKHINADTLSYLSSEGLVGVFDKDEFCTACFTGEYPLDVDIEDIVVGKC